MEMKKVQFTRLANAQLDEWKTNDLKIYNRIEQLIDAIQEDPYHGIGKPEPLKYEFSGYWSRRITKVHRLIYKVMVDTIIIYACKYHY